MQKRFLDRMNGMNRMGMTELTTPMEFAGQILLVL
jgi:hypothetical protein